MALLPSPTLDRLQPTEATIDTSLPMADWLRQGEANAQALDTAPAKAEPSRPIASFLRFHLTANTAALLPLAAVREVVMVPRQGILPVPHMPQSVLGAYNCRGNILWLVDLAVQFGYTPMPFAPVPHLTRSASSAVAPCRLECLSAIVLAFDDRPFAIVVPHVVDIEVHPTDQMQPAAAALFPAAVLPFVQGYFNPSHSPVLDLRTLLLPASNTAVERSPLQPFLLEQATLLPLHSTTHPLNHPST